MERGDRDTLKRDRDRTWPCEISQVTKVIIQILMYMQGYLRHKSYSCLYVVCSGTYQSQNQLRQGCLKNILRREDVVKQEENVFVGETIPEMAGALRHFTGQGTGSRL